MYIPRPERILGASSWSPTKANISELFQPAFPHDIFRRRLSCTYRNVRSECGSERGARALSEWRCRRHESKGYRSAECIVLRSTSRPLSTIPNLNTCPASGGIKVSSSSNPQIIRKGKAMKLLSCALLLMASMAFVLLGCSDDSTGVVSPSERTTVSRVLLQVLRRRGMPILHYAEADIQGDVYLRRNQSQGFIYGYSTHERHLLRESRVEAARMMKRSTTSKPPF